jgi:Flp pilus assembly protein TadB
VLLAAVLAGLATAAVLAPPAAVRRGSSGREPRRRSDGAGDLGDGTMRRDRAGAPRPAVTGAAALGVGAGVALLVGSGTGMLLGVLAVWPAFRWLSRLEPAASRRHREAVERDLPLLVDLLAACLRAGQAPGPALSAVTASLEPGPLRQECAGVVARLRLGGDPLAAWRAAGRHPQLGVLGRTVTRALDGGASVSDAMTDLAQELRRNRRAEVQARARAVGARAAAPLGLCLLPAFVLVGVVPVVAGSLGTLLHP